jgi:hypothetical protein
MFTSKMHVFFFVCLLTEGDLLVGLQLRVDLDTSGTIEIVFVKALCSMFRLAGKFQKVLDAILNETRPHGGVQQDLVETDLEILFKATEGKVGTDEVRRERCFGLDLFEQSVKDQIINMIATRSPDHLMHLNKAYKNRSKKGKTFVEELKVSGDCFFVVCLLMSCRSSAAEPL